MRFLKFISMMGLASALAACSGHGSSAPAALPTATLSAAPTVVASGAASTLTWSSTGATACTASGGWTGGLAPSGSQTTGALTVDTLFSLTCAGAGGTTAAVTTTVTILPLPTATLTADPAALNAGGTSTLTWSSTNATACTASDGWSGSLPTSGSQGTGALTVTTTYSLTCSGDGGASAAAAASVTVTPSPVTAVPTATLTANPPSVASGATSTLTWTSTNATACTASGGWTGALPANGSQTTAPVTANSTYSLTCSGPAGTSPVATVTVPALTGNVTLTPSQAAITLNRAQQFTAVVPGGGPAVWTVDGITNGSATVGTISSTGLYVAGTAPGSHTVTAASAADAAMMASAAVAVTDLAGVYTYHNNLARDGTNPQEYALTTTNVNAAHFGKVASCAVDGAVYAQPLWAANLTVNGAKHNVVFVATEHDGLYAFDGDGSPCAKLWSANLIDAAHGATAGETTVPSTLVGSGSGDIQPEIGITGTPVIDPMTGILYVVTKSVNAAHTTFYQRLHAIDVATGAEKTGSPVLTTGTFPGTGSGGTVVAFNSQQELQRSGLALLNGIVYVAWTAHEDKTPWYGWMMSYQYTGTALAQKSIINVAPNKQKGGIWMSGGAPAADAANNLYVITGNGVFDASSTTAPKNDYGDSLLQLTPTLGVSQWFTPADQANDASADLDFGSGGAAVLADLPAGNTVVHALICGGKDTTLYVLNRDMLGGYGTAGIVQQLNFGATIFATGAYWNNSFYLGGVAGPLQDYKLNTANAQLTLASSSTHKYGFAGATPSISSTGTQNGIVWTLETGAYCTQRSKACGPAVLYAHDAANVATELWNSSTTASNAAGYAVKFTLPTIANGRVYVATRGNNIGGDDASTSIPGELDIYGLKP
jgi:hypothetical protein